MFGLLARSIGKVHDALNLEIREHELATVLPMIIVVMENLHLQEWFGVDLRVPIIADCKVGTHWGDAMELEEHQIHNWDPSILTQAA